MIFYKILANLLKLMKNLIISAIKVCTNKNNLISIIVNHYKIVAYMIKYQIYNIKTRF